MTRGEKRDGDNTKDDTTKKQRKNDGTSQNIVNIVNNNSNSSNVITVSGIVGDRITTTSSKYWLKGYKQESFSGDVVEKIYNDEIVSCTSNADLTRRLMILEMSHYLEYYLWPSFNNTITSSTHIWQILLLVNEKVRQGLDGFKFIHQQDNNNNNNNNSNQEEKKKEEQSKFKLYFEKVIKLGTMDDTIPITLKTHYIVFLINCYQAMEDPIVRNECLKIVSYPMWVHLSEGRLDQELNDLGQPALVKKIRMLQRKGESTIHSTFFLELMRQFTTLVNELPVEEPTQHQEKEKYQATIIYCERFIELIIDLINQITTRRFFFAVLDDFHLLVKIRQSKFSQNSKYSSTFNELIKLLDFYINFEINNFTGEEQTSDVAMSNHYFKIQKLQTTVFKEFEEINELALSSVSEVENKEKLIGWFGSMQEDRLKLLCTQLNLLSTKSTPTKEYMVSLLVATYHKRTPRDTLTKVPLYPTESTLWDSKGNNRVGYHGDYRGERALALPKLNLQYLSFTDYLYRNYFLLREEATYAIRGDLEESIRRVAPRLDNNGGCTFSGWSRMALPLHNYSLGRVSTPNIGEKAPKSVPAQITYSLASIKQPDLVKEWDSLKEHDVLFLVSIEATLPMGSKQPTQGVDSSLASVCRVKAVRGCEVEHIMNDKGDRVDSDHYISNSKGGLVHGKAAMRYVRVSMDCNQYQLDVESNNQQVYKEFNLLVRRNAKENNFKAILETIVSLLSSNNSLPDWLSNTFLGYPSDSSKEQEGQASNEPLKLIDTFISKNHIEGAIKESSTPMFSIGKDVKDQPPYQIVKEGADKYRVESYDDPKFNISKKRNKIPFTSTQMEAIVKGTKEGLTLIQGPPGTGKTDVAVQIISNIIHNYPNQRTLIITHSNQALNQLFEKIYALDIDERYLLRLGHGHKQLNTRQADFTKSGRVDYMMNLRQHRLQLVDILAKTIGVTTDVGYTCETANHFYNHHIVPQWNGYWSKAVEVASPKGGKEEEDIVKKIVEAFPYAAYFQTKEYNVFKVDQKADLGYVSLVELKKLLQQMWEGVKQIFGELEECRVFELLKSSMDRYNYLLLKQSRVVAMTCTHAALKRNELIRLGFKFDNILMEESGQISDIESFIPLQLQTTLFKEQNRLKRLIMIGDHMQLPPIIQNGALAKFAHLDQSLFARLVRLGVPYITLDKQGRSRASLASLFTWRYSGLTSLELTTAPGSEFTLANPGFCFETQLIDVEGQEHEPIPHFYQNLEEAEYVVATYQYMRLIGYPANKIVILTTYNGQKALLRNIIREKCESNARFGHPSKITTVDKYQGQQDDIVLLSLVRTNHFGHIRDVRRLIVAMSRARLGLYIFCNCKLFMDCYETSPVFSKFSDIPKKLTLVPGETYPLTTGRTQKLNQNCKQDKSKEDSLFAIENSTHMYQVVQSNLE